jgi:hypothetical protein
MANGSWAYSIALFVALSTSAAFAQSEDDLIEEGITLREQGNDVEALARFERAYEEGRSARALAQIGMAEQALSRWAAAHDHLAEALRMGGEWIDARRGPLEQALATIRTHVGTLEVETVDGAEITIDGRRVEAGRPIAVAAGSFVLEVSAPGHSPERRELTIAAGQTLREEVELTPDAGGTSGGLAISPIGIAVAGAGAAMIIAGAITGGLALDRDGTLAMLCPADMCVEEARAVLDERRALAISTDVLIFGGLAIAATGAVLAFVLESGASQSSARRAEPRLLAGCSPSGCGVALRGSLP